MAKKLICLTCKKKMHTGNGPDPDLSCGGDCTACMADSGDPDCIESMYQWYKDRYAAEKVKWNLRDAFIISFSDEDSDYLVLDGTPQDVKDYKRWYAITNHFKMIHMKHHPTVIVTRRPARCSGKLETCGATTQAQYLEGSCPKCDP